MRRWTHLHTLIAGSLVGFGAATHLWFIVPIAIVLGFAAGVVYSRARHAARTATAKVIDLHDAKVATERARAAKLLAEADGRRLTLAEQKKERDRAYVAGAADQLHHLQAG